MTQNTIITSIAIALMALYFPLWCLFDFYITDSSLRKKDKHLNYLIKNGKLNDTDKNHKKKRTFLEPYEHKNFPKWKADIDIDGFWKSWTQNPSHEYKG